MLLQISFIDGTNTTITSYDGETIKTKFGQAWRS